MNVAKLNYISIAVNGGNNTLDWNRQLNLVAYAAYKRIVIYDTKDYHVIGTSVDCHSSVITSIAWVVSPYSTEVGTLISSSYDGVTKIWVISETDVEEKEEGKIQICVHLLVSLDGHSGSLTSCSAIYLPSKGSEMGSIFTATMGEDHIMKSWIVEAESGEYTEYCRYSLKGRSLAICSHLIPNLPIGNSSEGTLYHEYPILLLGGDDGKIYLFTFHKNMCECIGILMGHQDWVTSLDLIRDWTVGSDTVKLILASGSKDGAVRIWHISNDSSGNRSNGSLSTKSICLNIGKSCRFDSNKDICNQKVINCDQMFCTLQSVQLGHEGMISRVEWDAKENGKNSLKLLTCAQTEDRSIIVWEEDVHSNRIEDDTFDSNIESGSSMWVESARFGEVGGNREGFFNASFGPNGDRIIASSYQGGFHLWALEDGRWNPKPAVNGHFKEVVDLSWGPEGSYLLTVSKDQTTRMHTQLRNGDDYVWRETSRPQVHGYDMSCIASLGRFQFASAGEEKVIRCFKAPISVIKTFEALTGEDVSQDLTSCDVPDLASVPSLGLSNKGIEDTALPNNQSEIDCPNESKLMLGTLWPEISKLYGHGNDIIAMAVSVDGGFLASSCKATNPKDAAILIYDTINWKVKTTLEYHRLSVTAMVFSPCNLYLLSASRDRSWAIFKREEEEWQLLSSSCSLAKSEQHSRVIWSVCWIKNSSKKFISTSRDKNVVVWCPIYSDKSCTNQEEEGVDWSKTESDIKKCVVSWKREATCLEKEEVTAVDSFLLSEEILLIAIGTSNGEIIIRTYNISTKCFAEKTDLSPSHHGSVCKLSFKQNKRNILMLASCGDDNTTLIYEIEL